MPAVIDYSVREGATDGIVFPLFLDDTRFPGGSVVKVQLILAGWDGSLRGTLYEDALRIKLLAPDFDDIVYFPVAGELLAAYSPYRAYYRIWSDLVHWTAAPSAPDYYRLFVEASLL